MMEKKKYELNIAGVSLSILSDEREDFVRRLEQELDAYIGSLTQRARNCSKLDAALLCALDFAGEKLKAEKRVRNLEAQVTLYDANLRRMKEENAKLRGESFAAVPKASERQLTIDDGDAISEAAERLEEIGGEFEAEPEPAKPDEAAEEKREDKLRRIEELLRGRDN